MDIESNTLLEHSTQNTVVTNSCFDKIKKCAIDVLNNNYVKKTLSGIMTFMQLFVLSFAITFVFFHDKHLTFKENFYVTFYLSTQIACVICAYLFCLNYPSFATVAIFFIIMYGFYALQFL